jgi:hypothetical protein
VLQPGRRTSVARRTGRLTSKRTHEDLPGDHDARRAGRADAQQPAGSGTSTCRSSAVAGPSRAAARGRGRLRPVDRHGLRRARSGSGSFGAPLGSFSLRCRRRADRLPALAFAAPSANVRSVMIVCVQSPASRSPSPPGTEALASGRPRLAPSPAGSSSWEASAGRGGRGCAPGCAGGGARALPELRLVAPDPMGDGRTRGTRR